MIISGAFVYQPAAPGYSTPHGPVPPTPAGIQIALTAFNADGTPAIPGSGVLPPGQSRRLWRSAMENRVKVFTR